MSDLEPDSHQFLKQLSGDALAVYIRQYREIFDSCPIAHLATADRDANPHVIPVCCVSDGNAIFSVLDQKPKTVRLNDLKRVKNILSNPKVSLVIDHYDDNWQELWYLLVMGNANVIETGQTHSRAIDLLHIKYPQYNNMDIDNNPIIEIKPTRIISWGIP